MTEEIVSKISNDLQDALFFVNDMDDDPGYLPTRRDIRELRKMLEHIHDTAKAFTDAAEATWESGS